MAKKARNKEEEMEVRSKVDYDNTVKTYDQYKETVESSVEMIEKGFWQIGFKSRRELLDATLKNLKESLEEKSGEDYDSVEYEKVLNKTKLAHSKAGRDFDNYVYDVQKAVDVLHIFCADENLELFDDLIMKTPTFSRKNGKIVWKQVK